MRVARLSKLYKLVKLTRLFRLLKFMQNTNKAVLKLNSTIKVGMAFERLIFLLLIMVLLSHFIGCFWIFIAKTFTIDEAAAIDSWVKRGGYQDLTPI